MRTLIRNASLGLALAVLLGFPTITHAQTVLTTTTLTNAITATQTTFVVGSTANIVAGSSLYNSRTNETYVVLSVPVSGSVTVRRGATGAGRRAPASALLYIVPVASNAALGTQDPYGACTRGEQTAGGDARVSPFINVNNGVVWVCRSNLWQGATRFLVTRDCDPPLTP